MPETKEENREEDRKFKLTKSLTTVGAIFLVIIIVIFEFSKKNVNYKNFIFWVLGVAFLWVILFFGTNIVQKKKLLEKKVEEETKLPDALEPEELKKIIKKRIESFEYWNHIKRYGKVTPHSSGKNLVYEFNLDFVYPDKNLGKSCIFLINAHYPNERYAVLDSKATVAAIRTAANALSTNPEEEPDLEKRTEVDLNAGKQIVYEKRTKKRKKPEEKKPEKTEELA